MNKPKSLPPAHNRPGVILDKNFLQGVPARLILELAGSRQLVMPGALFYELLTTDPEVRRKCFAKLPLGENPVMLVDHIGVLLRKEIDTKRPAGLPSDHRLNFRFCFNRALSDADYRLPAEASEAVRDLERDIAADVNRLVELSEQVHGFFPHLLSGTTQQQNVSLAEAEQAIGDPEQVLSFYQQLECPDPTTSFPVINTLPGDWAHIRWLQVLMLFAMDLYVRYRGGLRKNLTSKTLIRLEHDVHDAQVLAMGALEGAIATQEIKLLRWWSILRPDGETYSKPH